MNGAESRLAALKPLLEDIHRRLELGFAFRLWDGSTVPAGWPADELAIAFADEGAIAGLIKAPNVTTLANLWAAGRVDLRNGTLFDLVARRPKGRTRDLRKSLASFKTVRALMPFLFVPRGGPWPLEHIGRDRES
ncbi:MAG: SAM-dependent methyltransferase, partial [Roseiarcus sp.]